MIRPDFDTYDENKNVTAETTGGVMNGYSFTTNQDAKDRLIDWTRTNGDTQDWDLTLVGDWDQFTENLGGGPGGGTTADRTHNDAHEINNISGGPNDGTLAHDAKGNLTREGNDTLDRYFYDFDNQLNAVDENQDGTAEIQYTYDALGRRVSKTVSGSTTIYVCETEAGMGKVVAEYEAGDPASDPVQKYVHGTYVDEPLMLITVNASTGTETNHYYHQNRLYTITALTNAMGVVEERYAYTPYGDQTILTPTGTPLTSSTIYQTPNPLGHQGLMHDAETSLIYNRARMLYPRLGRFMQRDPLGYVDGTDLYEYLKSSPNMRLDALGLESQKKRFSYRLKVGEQLLMRPNIIGILLGTEIWWEDEIIYVKGVYKWDTEKGTSSIEGLVITGDVGSSITIPLPKGGAATASGSYSAVGENLSGWKDCENNSDGQPCEKYEVNLQIKTYESESVGILSSETTKSKIDTKKFTRTGQCQPK